MAPMQGHILVFGTFASLIAPFGGFFASGLKRTFNIKDFGDSIPGHGGITDRMDCQFIMGFFAYMYFHSFIAVNKASLGSVIETVITGLTPEEQMELVKGISKHLVNQGIITEGVSLSSSPPLRGKRLTMLGSRLSECSGAKEVSIVIPTKPHSSIGFRCQSLPLKSVVYNTVPSCQYRYQVVGSKEAKRIASHENCI